MTKLTVTSLVVVKKITVKNPIAITIVKKFNSIAVATGHWVLVSNVYINRNRNIFKFVSILCHRKAV